MFNAHLSWKFQFISIFNGKINFFLKVQILSFQYKFFFLKKLNYKDYFFHSIFSFLACILSTQVILTLLNKGLDIFFSYQIFKFCSSSTKNYFHFLVTTKLSSKVFSSIFLIQIYVWMIFKTPSKVIHKNELKICFLSLNIFSLLLSWAFCI